MDVSIAVSLIRGQMGTVVEQAVNGAVETVLAEMLRIVGVKFEELKAQVATLQRDKAAVQREKSLKEKENDKIRAMLRYTELKLKYYRQGVEEEIQQRATTSSHPSSQNASPSSTARGLEPPPGETGPGSGLLDRTASENSQVIPASQSGSRPMVRVSHQSDEGSEVTELTNQTDQSDALPDGLLGYGGSGQEHGSEDLHYSGDGHASVHEKEEEEDGDWIISLQSGMQSAAPSAGHAPFPADSSTLPCSTPPVQVKEEFPTFQEVLSIKEEPEEEQVGTLLLDCQGRPAHLLGPEGQQSEFSGGSMMQRNLPGHMAHGFNFPGSTSCNDNNLVVSRLSAQAEMFLASEQKQFGEHQGVSEDPILGMGENLRPFSLKLDQGGGPSLEDPLKGFLSTTPETTQDQDKTQYQTSIHERKNFCLVCGKPQVKLARHLKVHKGHPEIALVLGLKPSCQKRKVLLEQLRNRGNFLHNSRVVAGGAGLLKVKRRPKEGRTRSYGCCRFCHGSFVSTDLWRHLMRCPCRKNT
ncbi:uncharacterized protein LOC130406547 isoform X1 [Gadus chalcogrammus]|uniref:uncharacterized protein LOC130406547 isoform X1 n=1 Tax=Gadus chalcogrammus TaxID=1042646 RepID=UPI0024C4AE60|nr:uncharacterized protein LOC130406547 isoform X1 [Gadus chalcogrammus]